ncbi:MAG: TM2 domain-containing protein [Eubacterium sp.]|nr:TM2 domain-containing protein [Eubacterium sp.]
MGKKKVDAEAVKVNEKNAEAVSGKEKKEKKKNYIVAGVLAFLFGSVGLHKFYMGEYKTGLLYVLFCWTGIPGTIAFYEGAKYMMEV